MWVDTHAHLDDARFTDLPAVLDRAAAAGVEQVLTIGIDLSTSQTALDLARLHPMVRAVVGIQPNHVAEATKNDFETINALAQAPEVVAIGESGLDRYWDRAPLDLQQSYFTQHLVLARELNKPIIIHCREAEDDILAMLRVEYEKHGPISGVMHSFTANIEYASAFLALGLHISFAGMLTYKSAESIRQAAARVPLDRLLLETDAPYLAPVPKRGQCNEPAFVVHTAEVLAACLKIPLLTLAQATTANARRLFSL